ncbi:MAG: VTT domain-containing protein [Eubacteriales bacterium]|nr:VTT domain-containing protein [Eubacteriales bacterium]
MKSSKKLFAVLKKLPLAVCLLFLVGYLIFGRNLDVSALLEYTPENPFLAACVLLLFYAVKSVSVVFPLMILRMVAGHLFSVPFALVVNILGMVICHAIPYWVGRFSGTDTVESLRQKYPKLESWLNIQQDNDLFLCFFLRIIGCLPGDVVSMYFGATKVPFLPYLGGSLLGALPNIITATFMGNSITDPTSPTFVISTLLTILLAGLSLAAHLHSKRK